MKKVKFYAAALASLLMLGACSSSDDLGGGTSESKDGKAYIAVNIKSVGTAGAASRADYQQDGNDYEDGTVDEGSIAKVRFFFFNKDGSPYYLKNSKVNYKDIEPDPIEDASADKLHTIEGKTDAIMMIEGETKTAPAYMLAVVNPQTLKTLQDRAYRESELRDDFIDSKFINDEGKNFVMTNSVYSENGARLCASSVSGHVAESSDQAKSNPVDLYVERVVAKVTADVDNAKSVWEKIENGTDAGKYRTKVGEINVSESEKRPVYAVVEGWGLADEDLKADLEKQILNGDLDKWTNPILGIDPWTSSDYHRCFWSASVAITPDGGSNTAGNYAYSAFTTAFGSTPHYTCPNTPNYTTFYNNGNYIDKNENALTKVLVAAKLVYYDKDNNPHNADICKYRGIEILGEDAVKEQIAQDNKTYYTYTQNASEPSKSDYVTLKPSDLTFTTTAIDDQTPLKDYEVRAVLSANTKVYQKVGEKWVDKTAQLNEELAASPVQVRHEGMTYYYTTIRHLANDPKKWGYYGVVRNHSYRVKISSISGFGTPVYDPSKVIDPTIPKDTETYLAARVNVLSWRVVTSSVDLDQTNK